MRCNIDNTSGAQGNRRAAAKDGETGQEKKKPTRSKIDGGTCDTGGEERGNYVFRESTELHSTEELWIAALPRCRCEERAILRLSATGYIFHRHDR